MSLVTIHFADVLTVVTSDKSHNYSALIRLSSRSQEKSAQAVTELQQRYEVSCCVRITCRMCQSESCLLDVTARAESLSQCALQQLFGCTAAGVACISLP